ncbi:MAG: hypothetical protein E7508_07135 [Ruminococcus sp.]|nr:hypothetical protein [Ruminococcus sp.]
MKKYLKDPIKFNFLVLLLFPVLFIIMCIMGFAFGAVKTAFFSPASAISYAFGQIFGGGDATAERISKAIMGVIGTYGFAFVFFGIMAAAAFLMSKLECRIKLYKTVTFIQYVIWMIIWFAFYIQMGAYFICSKWIVVLAVMFLPTAFLIACGMGKTASVKNENIIVEYEEENI